MAGRCTWMGDAYERRVCPQDGKDEAVVISLLGSCRGWSIYGAERSQPVATGDKCTTLETG
jgi:hypothetical protein